MPIATPIVHQCGTTKPRDEHSHKEEVCHGPSDIGSDWVRLR